MSPKSLLRHPECVASVDELVHGAFGEVLPDPDRPDASGVRRLVLSSGKLFYELRALRRTAQASHVALARIEQLYPFPTSSWQRSSLATRTRATWSGRRRSAQHGSLVVRRRAAARSARFRRVLRYVGRRRSASPATGSSRRHLAEQEAVVREAVIGDRPSPEASATAE